MSHDTPPPASSFHVLLEGVFDATEAKEILLALVQAKITHHSLRIFSAMERFGTTDDASEARLAQLRVTLTALAESLDQSIAQGRDVRVHSVIELHPQPIA